MIEEDVDRKLNALGGNLQSKIDANKLLKKAEKKAKRKERRDAVVDKIKGFLPKRKKESSETNTELSVEIKNKTSKNKINQRNT